MKKIDTKCDCHLEYENCKSPLYISARMIERKPKEMISCGKYIKLLNELSRLDA